MGRLRREFYVSAIYHVYNRGNNRSEVFKDDEDKELFLSLLDHYRARFLFKVYAICLMDNHYHMILETVQKHSISRIIHALALAYSIRYRKKYNYAGHLWQSRFKSRVIEREKYFFECLEYVHENPVKAKIVQRADEYRYSSARVYRGNEESVAGLLFLDSYYEAFYS
ncbi:MAG TPA: transposase [Candidatus Omnitrophota bacterium]|nr:transposase [Candidatus Omnitrophota bacterium]